ncbi:MAG: hypothetical protein ABIB97_04430 [Patescibacteria group bacterium]
MPDSIFPDGAVIVEQPGVTVVIVEGCLIGNTGADYRALGQLIGKAELDGFRLRAVSTVVPLQTVYYFVKLGGRIVR